MNVPTVTPIPGGSAAPRQTTVREAVAVVFRRKWLILGLFAVTTLTVLVITAATPTIYQSAGRVLVRRGEKQSSLTASREIVNQWEEELGSEIEIIKSGDVLAAAQQVVDAEPGPHIELSSREVDAEVMGKSNVIAISYQDRDPEVARRGARAMIQAYMAFREETLLLRVPRPYFDREIARADSETRGLIQQRREFANRAGVIEPAEQKRSLLSLEEELYRQRSLTLADLAAARADALTIHELQSNPDVEDPTFNSGGSGTAVEELKRRIVDQQTRVATLRESYRDDQPEVIAATATLDTLRGLLRRRVQGHIAIVNSRVSALEARLTSIDHDLAAVRSQLSALPDKEATLSQLDLEFSMSKDRYTDLLRNAREAAVNEVSSSPLTVVLLTPAGAARPRNAHDYVRLALAPAFSLVVGVGLAFFIDGLDLTVRTTGQAEEALELPVLAAITERRRRGGGPDVEREEPRS